MISWHYLYPSRLFWPIWSLWKFSDLPSLDLSFLLSEIFFSDTFWLCRKSTDDVAHHVVFNCLYCIQSKGLTIYKKKQLLYVEAPLSLRVIQYANDLRPFTYINTFSFLGSFSINFTTPVLPYLPPRRYKLMVFYFLRYFTGYFASHVVDVSNSSRNL